MTQQLPVVAGWYPDPQGVVRYWDGTQWTGQTAPPPPQYAQPQYMVTKTRKRTSHGLHLFLTIITAGVWGLLVWLPITIVHRFTHDKAVTRVG